MNKFPNPWQLVLIFLLATLPLASCNRSPATSPSGLSVVQIKIGNKTYNLEVAATEASASHGLMKRDSMPDDHGMIFVFPDEQPRAFWMKDTRFPLFILFLDHNGTVVSMAHMAAYEEREDHTTFSVKPAKYAIELNDDQEAASGVKVGQRLEIPAAAAQPASEP